MATRSKRKQESDILYNARRRMMRAADRAEKKGDIRQAMELRAQAESYKASFFAKGLKRGSAEYAEAVQAFGQRATGKTIGLTKSKASRKKQSRALLRGGVASQVLAATVDIWYKPGENIPASERYERIMRAFSAEDMLEVVEKLSAGTGKDFTVSSDSDDEKYDTLTVRLGMLYVSDL